MSRYLIVVSILLSISGCSLNSRESLNKRLDLKVGACISIDQELEIGVKQISDSRCPAGCCCIWAGEARVYFTITTNTCKLDTNLVLLSKLYHQGYIITLQAVNPYPVCSNPDTSDKSAVFLIESEE